MKNPTLGVIALRTLGLILFIQSTGAAIADSSNVLLLSYDIFSDGTDVGNVTVRHSRDDEGYTMAEHSTIDISGWWGKIDISSHSIEKYSREGELILADSKTRDGKRGYWSNIQPYQDGLSVSFSEIKKMTDKEKRALVRMGDAITNVSASKTNEILSISESIFAKRKLKPDSAKFTGNDFDTTESNLPGFIQKLGDKKIPEKLRLLSTEELKITSVRVTDLGDETITANLETVRSRHLKLSNSKFEPSHIWINQNATPPYMIRFTGEDEDGKFEIKLRSVVEPKNAVGSRKSTLSIDAPGKSEKPLITNKVTSNFSDSPCTPMACASFSRPTALFRLKQIS